LSCTLYASVILRDFHDDLFDDPKVLFVDAQPQSMTLSLEKHEVVFNYKRVKGIQSRFLTSQHGFPPGSFDGHGLCFIHHHYKMDTESNPAFHILLN
jgi:hypothetical protein